MALHKTSELTGAAHCGRASNHLRSRANRRPQSLPAA